MSAVTKHDFVFSLYLVSLNAVAAATVGIFFGIGFLLLAPPHPAAPLTDPVPVAQALEARDVPPPRNDDPGWGSSAGSLADKVLAIATPDVPSNRKTPVLEATTMETARIPPTGIAHPKRVRVSRHHQDDIGRHWAALWRSDASVGPRHWRQHFGSAATDGGETTRLMVDELQQRGVAVDIASGFAPPQPTTRRHRQGYSGSAAADGGETTRLMIDELQQRRGAVDTASGYGPPK
jgi:hypothetical protein